MNKMHFKRLIVLTISLGAMVASMGTALAASPKLSAGAAVEVGKGGSAEINVLINTTDKNYAKIVASIEGMGGRVTNTFKFVNGLSATIPASSLATLSTLKSVEKVTLDSMRYPGPQGGYEVETTGTATLNGRSDLDSQVSVNKVFQLDNGDAIQTLPANELNTYYSYFPDSMNTAPVFNGGNDGSGSLVAIIDTGTYANHFLLAEKVMDGVDISTDVGTVYEGATLGTNHYHGTHVGGIVAGAGAIVLPDAALLTQSIEYYADISLPELDADNKILPLFGTAPGADIYPIKVFPHTGEGAPTSTIIAGIEHAIDLKVNGGVDVDVINMSLGGGTGFEGRDLESEAVDAATATGIAVVVSAGNDGPAPQTIGSPSGAHTAITVGNVAHPVNTRVFWDYNYGEFGLGEYLYVDDNPQMSYSSSRGNTSDGRAKPTASAVGTFVLSADTLSPTALTFASGTSMSSPAMAGVVALLNSHSEANSLGASPYDYKQAVVAGSNPLPGFDAYEQGAGFIDATDAMTAFVADDEYGSAHPRMRRGYSAKSKKPHGIQLKDINAAGGQTFAINDLKPGYVEDFYFKLHPNAERIIVEVSGVDYGVDPLFFNSFEVHLMSGMRTTDMGYYLHSVNVWGDATLTAESMNSEASGYVFGVNANDLPLMDGNIRLSIENDWTSFDNITGTFTVTVEHGNQSDRPDETYSGTLNTGESDGFFPVGFGPNGVDLELNWKHDWSSYPTADMDMIIAWFDTDGNLFFDYGGASFNSPELVELDANNIDSVYVLIDGYETYGEDEPWTLEVKHK